MKVNRVLKPIGLLLINVVNISFIFGSALRIMVHDGWFNDIDVFDDSTITNDPIDPSFAKCTILDLLFSKS
jgi:hypothetical protein